MNGAGNRNYDDIINTQWPPAEGRPECMRLENRAKIFLPFAALKGFEDEVEERLRDEIARMDEKFTIRERKYRKNYDRNCKFKARKNE